MNRSQGFFTVCTVALAASIGMSQASAQEFVARIGHLESPQQPRHQGLEMVAELVAERTDGAVEFQLFPAAQLGNAREMNEGVQLGVIEGTVSPAAFLGGFNPLVSVLDIPYLLPSDRSEAAELRNNAFGDAILDSFDQYGFEAVALWPNGRKNFTSNSPLNDTDSFEGQRFRVMDSNILIEQFNAVDASAIALPFSELYTALQTGVVDGQENPLDTIATMRYYEVQDYLAISEHGAMEDVVLFNPTWWSSLPEEYQTAIVDAFLEVRPQVEELKEAAQATALETLEANGMQVRVVSDDERSQLRDIMYPQARDVYLENTGDAGSALIGVYEDSYADIVGN